MRLQFAWPVLLTIVFAHAVSAEVRVWAGTLTLPTYEEGLPNPNPPFDVFETTRFNYPYTLRENLTSQRRDHAWRAIYLENEYLKCSVLPDIGGHLYTCKDKVSGQPMFYANPSIKKAEIGYRGAWAAFGIEFNFPVSHNWVSMSPVDFSYAKHPDGSASVTVGNIDRVYGMEWSVELVLRPGSTLLEERVSLRNRSDVRRRFYWWNNAGVEVWDDSHIEYPMRYAASHGFKEVQPWPVDPERRDLSIIRNQTKGPVSLFVHGSREPFMGVWHPHTNTGTVHFAEYADLPAKKIWSWGVDPDGLDWRKALSDNNSAYVEVQGGLFRNQETYAFLQPRQSIHFSEFWMPVRDTGGIARANLAGVVNFARDADRLTTALNVNRQIEHASIRLLSGADPVLEEKVELTPERTWKKQIALRNPQEKVTFELRDAAGKILLQHTEGVYDWTAASEIRVGPQPSYAMPAPPKRSEDDWLQLGKDEELDGKTLLALSTYQEGLSKFTHSFELSKAAGRVAACLLRYEDAVRYLTPVEQRNTSDPEISYYLGIAYDGLGEDRKAQEAYENARRMPQFRAAAALRLGELKARQNQLKQAEAYLEESSGASPGDPRSAEELVAVREALGDKATAESSARQSLTRYSLSYFLQDALGTPDMAHLGADPDRVLNIAAEYMRLGRYRAALQVLSRTYPASPPDESEPGALLPQNHPMVRYFAAYCKEKLGDPAAQNYSAASQLSTAYVFPNRPEALPVLKAALRANSSDGTAHYLLGTFLFARGLTDDALQEWNLARQFAPHTPVLHADIGRALLRIKQDPKAALAAFRQGLDVDPRNPEIYFGTEQALSLLQRPAPERVQALERYPDQANMPRELVYELALSRTEAGDFGAALSLFHNRFFPREEGGTNVRQVWVEVLLEKALSLARSQRCSDAIASVDSIGKPVPGLAFTRDGLEPFLNSARTQYLIGIVKSTCGHTQEAAANFQRAVQQKNGAQLVWAYAAAKKLGEADASHWQSELTSALDRMERNSDPGSQTGSWLYTAGTLESALGHKAEADAMFRQSLLLPSQTMSHHLSRLALANATPE